MFLWLCNLVFTKLRSEEKLFKVFLGVTVGDAQGEERIPPFPSRKESPATRQVYVLAYENLKTNAGEFH